MTASLAIGLEQGALALLGSKSSRALLTLVTHDELILLCLALLAVTGAVPRRWALVGRVSSLMGHVFATIALNTALAGVVVERDPPMTCLNLLGVYFLGMAARQEDAGLAAQYLLVSNLSQALRQGVQESLGVAWALVTVPPVAGIGEDLQQLARLVTVETFTGFLRAHLPSGGLLATTLLLLYLTTPFVDQFPVLVRMNRFAVFAVSNDPQLQGVSPWLIAACLWGLWLADPEPTGRAFAASAGSNVAVLAVLDAIGYAMDNDPAPVLVALLVAIQILQAS
jgi:hypothetical protein